MSEYGVHAKAIARAIKQQLIDAIMEIDITGDVAVGVEHVMQEQFHELAKNCLWVELNGVTYASGAPERLTLSLYDEGELIISKDVVEETISRANDLANDSEDYAKWSAYLDNAARLLREAGQRLADHAETLRARESK